MTPYYADESVTLYHGDSLAVLRQLPAASVNACVTSPPYYGLRDYGIAGQYGLEASPAEYVETMRAVFDEVRRVLTDDGTLWLNLGDSYSTASGGAPTSGNPDTAGQRFVRPRAQDYVPEKNLLGMPWRVAFRLQEGGWTLRNAIVWNKPNGMPTSVRDRFSTRYELVFLLTKRPHYAFDLDAVREPHAPSSLDRYRYALTPQPDHPSAINAGAVSRDGINAGHVPGHGINPGDVWTIPTQPLSLAHFAVMPPALAERCILAGCKPGGTVLDPFSGSGTTGLAATRLGRRYVGIDLNAEYLDLSLRTRLGQTSLIDPEVSAHGEGAA